MCAHVACMLSLRNTRNPEEFISQYYFTRNRNIDIGSSSVGITLFLCVCVCGGGVSVV